MKECITVYLSGEGGFGPIAEGNWRRDIMQMFYQIARYDEVKMCVINPTDFVLGTGAVTDRQIKAFLFGKIRHSDVVICNLSNTEINPYVAEEIQFAVNNHINIIGIKGNNSCTWIEHVDCDAVFDTMEEAVTYIKEYYMRAIEPINIGA